MPTNAPAGPVAAVDCGTNSTRLLVAGPDGATLERHMTITRLGQGVDRTGALAGEAIERTVAVLGGYRRLLDAHGAVRVRATATSAARDASNRTAFFGPAEEAIGVPLELLSGDEEGRLSFAGATAALDPGSGPWLVADIGGGSTELAVGSVAVSGASRSGPTAVRSLPIGCVRMTERYLAHDPPLSAELEAARDAVRTVLDTALAEEPRLARADGLIGLAGTVAAAAALDLRLDRYDRDLVHHHRLGAATVRDLLDELAVLDAEGRRRRPGMEEARAGVVVGGLVVLDTLLDRLGVEVCLVSEADILDGLVMSLLRPDR